MTYTVLRYLQKQPESLARNLKADVNILVYGNWRRHATCLYRDLFNQNGMDFVTGKSFCKTPVVDEKRLVFRGLKSAREII